MRLIDADTLTKNDEVTEWLSINPIRTGKMLKAFSELFIKKVNEMPTINAIPIPDNATNGDVIKAMFPSIDFTEMAFTVHATTSVTSNGVKGGISYDFWKDWWNAPYKAESEAAE